MFSKSAPSSSEPGILNNAAFTAAFYDVIPKTFVACLLLKLVVAVRMLPLELKAKKPWRQPRTGGTVLHMLMDGTIFLKTKV